MLDKTLEIARSYLATQNQIEVIKGMTNTSISLATVNYVSYDRPKSKGGKKGHKPKSPRGTIHIVHSLEILLRDLIGNHMLQMWQRETPSWSKVSSHRFRVQGLWCKRTLRQNLHEKS